MEAKLKRAFLLAVAAVFALQTSAIASTAITFDGFCDGMKISVSKNHFASVQTGKCLHKTVVIGSGFKVTVDQKTGAGFVVLGVNWEAFDGKPKGSEQYSYLLQYPFKTGGTWREIFTRDGVKIKVLSSGTYTVPHGRVRGREGPLPTSMHSDW